MRTLVSCSVCLIHRIPKSRFEWNKICCMMTTQIMTMQFWVPIWMFLSACRNHKIFWLKFFIYFCMGNMSIIKISMEKLTHGNGTSLTSFLSRAFCSYKLFSAFQYHSNTGLVFMNYFVEHHLMVILIYDYTGGSFLHLPCGLQAQSHSSWKNSDPLWPPFFVAMAFSFMLDHFLWTTLAEALLTYQQWSGGYWLGGEWHSFHAHAS